MTTQEINEAVDELRAAMLESVEASQKEEEAKLAKIKAHKRLLLAREMIRNIQFSC